jgi:hypothetical protein
LVFRKIPTRRKYRASGTQEAIEDAGADVTGSILDLDHISATPDLCVATPLQDAVLRSLLGTTEPKRAMVDKLITKNTIEEKIYMLQQNLDLFEYIERGYGIYIVIYKDNEPDELFLPDTRSTKQQKQ